MASGTAERAIIVGASIGGLSAAVALKRIGVPVTVFEESSGPSFHLSALKIFTNGVIALEQFGLGDALRGRTETVEHDEFLSRRGERLVRISVGEIARRHGVPPPIMIRRSDLAECLLGPLDEGEIEWHTVCESFEQDADGVTVRLAGGRVERGALLVGADGIDSRIRSALHPKAKPRYAGYQYLRAVSEFSMEPQAFIFVLGRGDRFLVHDLGRGWVYWCGMLVNPPGSGDPPGGKRRELLDRLRGFPSPTTEIIEATPEEAIDRTDIRDLRPLDSWGEGRVTLLGDAAHAATPNLGRGGSEGIEDAAVLADALAARGGTADPAAALRHYEAERRAATAKVQTMAWRIGKVLSLRNPVATAVRDRGFKWFAGRGMAKDMDHEFAELAATSSRASLTPPLETTGQRAE